VLVVVDLTASQEDVVADAIRRLRAVHAPLVGLLLNRDRGAEVSRYDYYLSPKPKRKRAEQRLAASSGDGASEPASPSGRRA